MKEKENVINWVMTWNYQQEHDGKCSKWKFTVLVLLKVNRENTSVPISVVEPHYSTGLNLRNCIYDYFVLDLV